MRVLIFDTETSGLDPQWNVILQLSYQIVDSDTWNSIKIVNHFFPWPENKARVSEEAISVNGLTEEVLQGKQLSDRKTALEEFVKDKDSCDLLVAHNLEFDKKFIIASCREEGVKHASSGWLQTYDTMKRTTRFCQIPHWYGSGFKWPKLTELADRLYIDYSKISLHDSSGDVELTKLCFERIVAEGLYRLPQYNGISVNLTLHVESPDDIRVETLDGEVVDEIFFKNYLGESKKTFNAVRQELIKLWSEENEEERNDLIYIYRKSPKIKKAEDFRAEIDEIKPNQYVRKVFDEQAPSKDKIREELELEAKNEVASWKFWMIKQMRKEYVNEHLESYYQQQIDAYNQRYAQHEESEDKAEKEYNLQSQKLSEERRNHLSSLLEGRIEIIEKEFTRLPSVISLSFPYHVEAHLDGTVANIILSLPQPKDLPQMEGVRLASGNYKIREIPDKNKKKDYSEWVLGIALYVASYYFNVSPSIDTVNIDGRVTMGLGDSNDIHLYNISFNRAKFESLDVENVEIKTALSQFSVSNNLTKEVLATLFAVEEESKQEVNFSPIIEFDPLLNEVAHFVVQKCQASTSDLQRTYAIGYNRAGRIFEQLEEVGIVGPACGSKPREVLVQSDEELLQILDKYKL